MRRKAPRFSHGDIRRKIHTPLRNQACLNSFMSGFRLACGIQRELLAEQSPYCFAEDEEQRALKLMEQDE